MIRDHVRVSTQKANSSPPPCGRDGRSVAKVAVRGRVDPEKDRHRWMVRSNRKCRGAGRARRRRRSGWDDRPSNGIGTEPKAPRTLLKRRKVFGRVRGASHATQHRRNPVEPRPGWVARLAEAARQPAPAPERRLALPKAAYSPGQLGRRAWPIPPVGPPPSELRPRSPGATAGRFGPRWSLPRSSRHSPRCRTGPPRHPDNGRGTRVSPPASPVSPKLWPVDLPRQFTNRFR